MVDMTMCFSASCPPVLQCGRHQNAWPDRLSNWQSVADFTPEPDEECDYRLPARIPGPAKRERAA